MPLGSVKKYGESRILWEHPCSRYRLWSAFRYYTGVLFFIAMDNKFVKGDIVKFIDEANVRPDYLHNVENIYKIVSIEDTAVILSRSFSGDIETEISAITGVVMDGEEDKFIYSDPVIMASIVWPGDAIPVHHKDYTYFLDANVIFPNDKTMRDFVKENGFTYVHELQHFLREQYQTDDLKINI